MVKSVVHGLRNVPLRMGEITRKIVAVSGRLLHSSGSQEYICEQSCPYYVGRRFHAVPSHKLAKCWQGSFQ